MVDSAIRIQGDVLCAMQYQDGMKKAKVPTICASATPFLSHLFAKHSQRCPLPERRSIENSLAHHRRGSKKVVMRTYLPPGAKLTAVLKCLELDLSPSFLTATPMMLGFAWPGLSSRRDENEKTHSHRAATSAFGFSLR